MQRNDKGKASKTKKAGLLLFVYNEYLNRYKVRYTQVVRMHLDLQDVMVVVIIPRICLQKSLVLINRAVSE